MSAPTDAPVSIDIHEFEIVNAVKFAKVTKHIKEGAMTRGELELFVAEMEDDVSLFCTILANIIRMSADDVAVLFPVPSQLTRMLTASTEYSNVFIKHAMQFYAAYATSSLYSSEDAQLYEKVLIMIGTCVIFYKMEIKFAVQIGDTCVVCGAGCAPALMCLECKAGQYCSRRCRQIDWKAGHATACKKE